MHRQQSGRWRPWSQQGSGAVFALIVLSMLTLGCQGMAATTQNQVSQPSHRADNTVADWPFKFVQHNFGAFCYSTYGCRIAYGGYHRVEPEQKLQISSDSLGGKYPGNLGAGYLGIMNFPVPAEISWRSRDGASHQATVDIGEIFKDQLILHHVPKEDIPEAYRS